MGHGGTPRVGRVARATFFLFLAAVPLTETPAASAAPPSTAKGTAAPVYMDYSTMGVRAVSPDGNFAVTVTGKRRSLEAWVTVDEPAAGWSVQVWPIERGVTVLWRPDSRSFALTDNRYVNESYVLVVGTRFRMAGPRLGVRLTDLTPLLRNAFAGRARRYYREHFGTPDFDGSYSFYAKALRWVGNDQLLVGVSAVTSAKMPPGKLGTPPGVKGWVLGYLIDVPSRRVVRTLSQKSVETQYGIDLSKSALQD